MAQKNKNKDKALAPQPRDKEAEVKPLAQVSDMSYLRITRISQLVASQILLLYVGYLVVESLVPLYLVRLIAPNPVGLVCNQEGFQATNGSIVVVIAGTLIYIASFISWSSNSAVIQLSAILAIISTLGSCGKLIEIFANSRRQILFAQFVEGCASLIGKIFDESLSNDTLALLALILMSYCVATTLSSLLQGNFVPLLSVGITLISITYFSWALVLIVPGELMVLSVLFGSTLSRAEQLFVN